MPSLHTYFRPGIGARFATLSVVLFAPAFLWAQQDRIAGPISETRMVALKGNVSPRAQPQFDRGPVDPARKLDSISLVFKPTPEQQADLEQLLNQQQDRSSPQYHRWLTPEQYADRFGLAPGDIAKIRTATARSKTLPIWAAPS